ncbi:hypothetical protein Gohar_015733 [Gossypium harknessii]|uniref:RNase H type-1 domain-containing protein n=1 Tax=Gossypium harknessii TaxID=34285 RepID=A0A7J9G0N2_9ROSI|nr:hypothetical protein [Gossypium harknessii]
MKRGFIYSLMGIVARSTGNTSTDGLLIMLSKGYKRAMIQTDKLDVVQALTDNGLEDSGITVLRRVQRIMRSVGQWRIRYIPREDNTIADQLAKLSLAWQSSLQVFDNAVNAVLEALE